MRTDQFVGLPDTAKNFLAENEVASETCFHCKQSLPRDLMVVGYFIGMHGDKYPLHRHKLTMERYADEFLQAAPWSSGPVHFLGLCLKNGKEYTWSVKDIEGA